MLPALVVLLMAGCGYTFMGGGAAVPDDVRTLFVELVTEGDNDPVKADALGRELRQLVRREGRFDLVRFEHQADATLQVELVSTLTLPVAFDRFDDVLDYETTIRVNGVLETRDGRVLWEHKRIAATRAHGAVAGAVVTSSSEFQSSERLTPEVLEQFDTVQLGEQRKAHANRQLITDIAAAVYELMMEGR